MTVLPLKTSTEPNTFKIPAAFRAVFESTWLAISVKPLIGVDAARVAGGAIGAVGGVARHARVIERHDAARINPPAIPPGAKPRVVHLSSRVPDHVDVCQCQHVPRVVDQDSSAVSVAHATARQRQGGGGGEPGDGCRGRSRVIDDIEDPRVRGSLLNRQRVS